MEKERSYVPVSALILCFLLLYPIRHAACGADLWDAGYNCGNFVNPGPDHMSSVWFFSTYLSTVFGHFLSLLPGGSTFLGLNIYTGLVVSAGVIMSYFFYTKKTGLPKWITVSALLLMMSLCYSPTSILYGHLSNVLFSAAVICLYLGLNDNREYMLAVAGFILGINLFVRFSNLVQTGMIAAVWYYLFLKREEYGKGTLIKCLKSTLICMGGYFLAVVPVLAVIGFGFGAGSYFSGVAGLFSMDQDAGYYTFSYMLKDMVISYLRGAHRLLYIAAFVLAGYIAGRIMDRSEKAEKNEKAGRVTGILTASVITLLLLILLVCRGLIKFDFYHYAVAYNTAAMLLDMVIGISVFTIITGKCSDEKKLLSSMILLQVLLTSIGSNTGISVTMNCMYLSAPYLFLMLSEINGTIRKRKGLRVTIPLAVFNLIFLVFLLQSIMFGLSYVYEEGNNTGRRDSYVTGNHVLWGIRMSGERAELLQDMTDCINEEGLSGHDSIVYGFVPAIAYYLDMPSVISSWPDLASYRYDDMKADMKRIRDEAEAGEREYPVVIIGNLLETSGIAENPKKTDLLYGFMEEQGYVMIHSNETFEIWRHEDEG